MEKYSMVKKQKIEQSLQYKKGKFFHNARKSLHFDEKDTCMKKQSGLFDVTMRAWYNAEVCELVDTYMLLFISENYNKKDFRLYHDDGLGVVKIKEMKKNEKKNIYKRNKILKHRNNYKLATQKIEVP